MVDAIDALRPVRPGRLPLNVTQDRIAERRFLESAGAIVAPWCEVRTNDDLRAAYDHLGPPIRLKVATGGYDGRGQLRLASPTDLADALERLGHATGGRLLAETEMPFQAELSIVVARSHFGGIATYPLALQSARRRASSSRASRRRRSTPTSPTGRRRSAERLAVTIGVTGTLTAELFLMPDGGLVVNELAPRVHNSGHWTIEGAATSQFEQHIRAICGLGLGSTERARADGRSSTCSAPVTLRPARLEPPWPRRAPWPTRPSTCTSTTSGRCSSAARWAT